MGAFYKFSWWTRVEACERWDSVNKTCESSVATHSTPTVLSCLVLLLPRLADHTDMLKENEVRKVM